MEIRRELMKELKNIYDNEDFVCSTVDIARTEDAWNTIIDYIRTARLNGDNVTSDEIQLIAIRLREENDDCERVSNQVVAAI